MKFKHLFFDLDGTLSASEEGIIKSMKFALDALKTDYSNIDLKQTIGPPLSHSFRDLFDFDEEKVALALKHYRSYYEEVGMLAQNKLYDGIVEMLETLSKQGYVLSVVTSKPEPYAKKIIDYFAIDKYFAGIYGSTFTTERVHKVDTLRYAIEQSGAEKSEIVMIGDRFFDLEAAEMAGISAIGVLYGYGNLEELSKYKSIFIAETVLDLQKFFA